MDDKKKGLAQTAVEGAAIFEAVDADTGEARDLSALEKAGVAYDATQQPLDLTHEEKRRVTALMMAIQAYKNIIIQDAAYYEAVCREHRNNDGPRIQPATMNEMVKAAMDFDDFISGKLQAQRPADEAPDEGE